MDIQEIVKQDQGYNVIFFKDDSSVLPSGRTISNDNLSDFAEEKGYTGNITEDFYDPSENDGHGQREIHVSFEDLDEFQIEEIVELYVKEEIQITKEASR